MIALTPHPVLPIEPRLPEIADALAEHDTLILSAEPGAGKSTMVPLAFLDAQFIGDGRIILLEPRRIAARAAAARMAELLGEKVGGRVGYRTGTDTVCGRNTRIEVVTEAILTRMIQHDPELPGVALIIFDEFHERNIHADLGLALALDVRANLRPELRLLIMSATLDVPALQRLIPDAVQIHVPGRVFPVQTVYSNEMPDARLEKRMAFTIKNAVAHFPGSVLAFLPGEGEIHAVKSLLEEPGYLPADVEVMELYGSMPAAAQDKVLTPPEPGVRRVVLSTAIAETSLTVPGVRIVVDSGLARVSRFSPGSGMDRLETVRESLAGAEQRRGRAGRLEEGVCIRLWSEVEERGFPPQTVPEIFEADLCPLALELVRWGIRTPAEAVNLPLPDQPPKSNLVQAYELLADLDVITGNGTFTEHGRKIASLPVHPRLAHAVLASGSPADALWFAAVLSEHGNIRCPSADFSLLLHAARNDSVKKTAEKLRSALKLEHAARFPEKHADAALFLAMAFPDRIAKRRPGSLTDYVLANGMSAVLEESDPLANSEFLAVAETGTFRGKTRIRAAAPLAENDLPHIPGHRIRERFEANWDASARCVRCEKIRALGSIVLSRSQVIDPPSDVLKAAFLDGIRKSGFGALNLSKSELAFRQRVTFLHRHGVEGYPDLSEEGLMANLEDWLGDYVEGFKRLDDLKKLDMRAIMEASVSTRAVLAMRELAPERLEVPSGSAIRIDYSDPVQPQASVRLQELFGMKNTPKLAGGKVPLLMDILSPAMRTVQKTANLESFWKESYFLVRKDMRGRYPKHDWPEDPATAIAHRGVKKPVKN